MSGVDETVDAAAVSKSKAKIVVIELQEQDILVVRGAPFNNYVGNVRFRALVATRKDEYNSAARHRVKNEIAQQVREAVTQSGGRFLRRVESPDEAEELGTAETSKAWVIADEAVAMEKIKQALRNKEESSSQHNVNDNQLSTLHGSSTATMGARPAQP
jgi:hypothetical protein